MREQAIALARKLVRRSCNTSSSSCCYLLLTATTSEPPRPSLSTHLQPLRVLLPLLHRCGTLRLQPSPSLVKQLDAGCRLQQHPIQLLQIGHT